MKTLLPDFEKHGFHYRLVERHGDVAVYLKYADHWQHREHFEVFRVQSHDGREIAGRFCEAAEYLPSSEQWGALGWSFQSLGAALNKLGELTSRQARIAPAKPAGNDFAASRV